MRCDDGRDDGRDWEERKITPRVAGRYKGVVSRGYSLFESKDTGYRGMTVGDEVCIRHLRAFWSVMMMI